MKILVVGSGGREHALAHKISQSPLVDETIAAPGNVGMEAFARLAPVKAEDVKGLLHLAQSESVDLVVIGPEAPLVDGLADLLEANNIPAFGPGKGAAQLEGSKGYMKDILAKYDIPTANYRRFTNKDDAKAYVREQGAPIVVKTDGLAAGRSERKVSQRRVICTRAQTPPSFPSDCNRCGHLAHRGGDP